MRRAAEWTKNHSGPGSTRNIENAAAVLTVLALKWMFIVSAVAAGVWLATHL